METADETGNTSHVPTVTEFLISLDNRTKALEETAGKKKPEQRNITVDLSDTRKFLGVIGVILSLIPKENDYMVFWICCALVFLDAAEIKINNLVIKL